MEPRDSQEFFLSRVTSATIRVVLVGGWIAWCLQIVLPFLVPILWGAIIATAVYPLARRVRPAPALGAAIFGAVALAVIVVPTYLFFDSVGGFVVRVGRQWAQGQLKLPPPRAEGRTIGRWSASASTGCGCRCVNAPASVVEAHLPQLREVGRWLAQSLGGLTLGILQSLFAVAVAVAFLMKAEASQRALVPIAERIAPRHGPHLVEFGELHRARCREGRARRGCHSSRARLGRHGCRWRSCAGSVGAPGADLRGRTAADPNRARPDDGVRVRLLEHESRDCVHGLEPLRGRGRQRPEADLAGSRRGVPTLVIVIGAIGGMISSGIIGLFVGAVVLAVGYELFAAWVRGNEGEADALEQGVARVDGSTPQA